MSPRMNRRSALGFGTFAAAGTLLASSTSSAAAPARKPTRPKDTGTATEKVQRAYTDASTSAGGAWNSYITLADGTSNSVAVDSGSTQLVEAYSVNKIAVAVAVLDKIDRGELTLDHQIDVTADIVIPDSDGIFSLDGAYPSTVTVGHALALLLTVSDDTCVRLCGLVCPAKEINDTLVAKGFPNTQVEPVANPNRFYLGKTTPREMHDLLQQLAAGTVLSADSTSYLLKLLRAPVAFTDGIRRVMSSDERLRVATKAGWLDDGRHEAGIMFSAAGAPVLIYSLFAFGQPDADNFGATHPAVAARAVMGRAFFDAVGDLAAATPAARRAASYRPSNGG